MASSFCIDTAVRNSSLTHIREMLSSILVRDTYYPDTFTQLFSDPLANTWNIGHDRFLTHFFQFISLSKTGRSPVQVPDKVDFFNASNRSIALGSTQPLTEMSTRNLPAGKKRPTRRGDNLTAICEPIV
jgi:hypothetical protein